jgi:pimeloyl-ACP methyl ester carboxylesterase
MRLELQDILISIGDIELGGSLTVPEPAAGLVIFVHGSGSSRYHPRNRHLAALLHEYRLATLLFDLLTGGEKWIDAIDATPRFDVEMLAERVASATDRLIAGGHAGDLPIGYLGDDLGTAAALIAAASRPAQIAAVVSRGGRPDRASSSLPSVCAPTLLIVGGADPAGLPANQEAAARLSAPHRLAVIPGAGPLFDEPGALEEVAHLAGSWFTDQFAVAQLKHAS